MTQSSFFMVKNRLFLVQTTLFSHGKISILVNAGDITGCRAHSWSRNRTQASLSCHKLGMDQTSNGDLTNKPMANVVFFARNMGLTMGWTVGLTMGFISNLTSFVGETWWLTMGFFIKTKLVVFNWSCHTHQLWYIVISSYQENLQYIIQHSSNPTIYICGWLHCHVYRKECWIICILSNNPILRYVVRVPVSKGYTFSEGKHS